MLPFPFFVTCWERVYVTFFPLEEREWLFASRSMTVSSRVWLSENDFRRVLVDAPFYLGVSVSFSRRMIVDKGK